MVLHEQDIILLDSFSSITRILILDATDFNDKKFMVTNCTILATTITITMPS